MSVNDLIYHHLYTTNLKKDEAQLDDEINTLVTELGLNGIDNLESVVENMVSIKAMIHEHSDNNIKDQNHNDDNDTANNTPISTTIMDNDVDISSQLAELNEITNNLHFSTDITSTINSPINKVQYNKVLLKYQMLSSFIMDLLNSMNSIDIYNDELLLDILNDCSYIQD